MKVVHLNTSINQSSAPYKLHEALLKAGIDSKILALNPSECNDVTVVQKNVWYKIKRKVYAIVRQLQCRKQPSEAYMPFTRLPVGLDVSKVSEIQEADIIYLHWVCGDYMAPDTIQKLLTLNKPVLCACHDNYPFTGGCHVRLGCDRYQTGCGKCPQLHSEQEDDATKRLMARKKKSINSSNLIITSPSSWMDENVSKSWLFHDKRHYVLPNAIDTELFAPLDKTEARKHFDIEDNRYVILVGLKANEKIPYNGTEYLWNVLNKLQQKCPDGKLHDKQIEIIVFGVEQVDTKCMLPIRSVGYIREQEKLAKLYAAADVYLVTSLEDSFNQTVAECMACGTPVVAFNNGGIADIIDHEQNGYLVRYIDVDDMVQGMMFKWNDIHISSARMKIEKYFSYEKVSEMFRDMATKIMN